MPRKLTLRDFAMSDLDAAKTLILQGGDNFPAICTHSQQFAEKMIKVKLRELGYDAWGHDLVGLLNDLAYITGTSPGDDLMERATLLSNQYLSMRYDDVKGESSFGDDDGDIAYESALMIVDWVERFHRGPDGTILVTSLSRKPRRNYLFRRVNKKWT